MKPAIHHSALPYRRFSLVATVALALACEPAEGWDEGQPPPAPGGESVVQPAVQGCEPLTDSEWKFVGDSYNTWTGDSGSFPFVRDPATGAMSVCLSPHAAPSVFQGTIVRSHSELDQFFSSMQGVSGSGAYGGVSAEGSAKRTLMTNLKLTSDFINLVVAIHNPRKKVVLDAPVPFIPEFEADLQGPDGKKKVHDVYGDVYVKTAHLGHYMFLVFQSEVLEQSRFNRRVLELALKAKYEKLKDKNASLSFEGKTEQQVTEMINSMRITVHQIVKTEAADIPWGDLTLQAVEGAINNFRAAKGNVNLAVISREIEPFGLRRGHTEADFYEWKPTAEAIRNYKAQLATAEQIASAGTDFRNLTVRGNNLADMIRRIIDRLASPPLPPHIPDTILGEMARAIYFSHPALTTDFAAYRQRVDNSFLLKAGRQDKVCLGRGARSAGIAGELLVGESCNAQEDQLYLYDSTSKQIQSISGLCLAVAGGGKTGDAILAGCNGSDPGQRWRFAESSRKIAPFSTRTISVVANDHNTELKGRPGFTVTAATWSRDDYRQYDWDLIKAVAAGL